MAEIDLHIHTTASEDGELSPREIFTEAKRIGLRAIAFADHDSVDAVAEGLALSREFGIAFAPAVEISTRTQGYDLHVLGYFVDPHHEDLRQALSRIVQNRATLAENRVRRLRELGFAIEADDVFRAAAGRPPTTRAILTALRGRPENMTNPDFSRYISGDRADSPVYNFWWDWLRHGRPAYLEMTSLSSVQAVRLIREIGGVSVLAHPGRTPLGLAEGLLDAGLDGIEVYCTTHSPEDVRTYEAFVREHGLLATAGSDFHGPTVKPGIRLGDLPRGDFAMFTTLRELARERGGGR